MSLLFFRESIEYSVRNSLVELRPDRGVKLDTPEYAPAFDLSLIFFFVMESCEITRLPTIVSAVGGMLGVVPGRKEIEQRSQKLRIMNTMEEVEIPNSRQEQTRKSRHDGRGRRHAYHLKPLPTNEQLTPRGD